MCCGKDAFNATQCLLSQMNKFFLVHGNNLTACPSLSDMSDSGKVSHTWIYRVRVVCFYQWAVAAINCCILWCGLNSLSCGLQIEPWKRPRFADLVHSLEAMKYSALMKVILMDLSRLDLLCTTPAVSTDTTMDREALENILGMTHPQSVSVVCFG